LICKCKLKERLLTILGNISRVDVMGSGTNLSLKEDSDSSIGRKREAKSRSGHL